MEMFEKEYQNEAIKVFEGLEEVLKERIDMSKIFNLPDVKKFMVSQILLGSITKFNPIVDAVVSFEKSAFRYIKILEDSEKEFPKVVIQSFEDDILVKEQELMEKIKDIYWHILKGFNVLEVQSRIAGIESASELIKIEEADPNYIQLMGDKMLLNIEKYLFENHELEEIKNDFLYYYSLLIKFTTIEIVSVNSFNDLSNIDKQYTLSEIIK